MDVPLDVPYCFYPAGHQSHAFLNYTKIERGVAVYYRIDKASGYPKDVEVVRMDILVSDWKTLRIKVFQFALVLFHKLSSSLFAPFFQQIYDPVRERYQVPQFTVEGDEPFLKLPPLEDATDPQYKVLLSRTTFGFKVLRWNNEAMYVVRVGTGWARPVDENPGPWAKPVGRIIFEQQFYSCFHSIKANFQNFQQLLQLFPSTLGP